MQFTQHWCRQKRDQRDQKRSKQRGNNCNGRGKGNMHLLLSDDQRRRQADDVAVRRLRQQTVVLANAHSEH